MASRYLERCREACGPQGHFQESRPPRRFSSYVALMSSIIDSEPSSFEEATGQQVWKDAMMEEYRSIMKNDVWDIVPRPEGKFVYFRDKLGVVENTSLAKREC
jgi:hypothetical protein